jgi:hypothetical protein
VVQQPANDHAAVGYGALRTYHIANIVVACCTPHTSILRLARDLPSLVTICPPELSENLHSFLSIA